MQIIPVPASPVTAITRLNSTVKDLFIYLYNLSPLDVDVFFLLMKNKKPMTIEDMAKKLRRDKSNIFRSVQKLVTLGICTKDAMTLEEGGYYHVYAAVDIKTFKLETEKRINELKSSFDRILKRFESDMESTLKSLS
jgi:predicted transcriptional regulator